MHSGNVNSIDLSERHANFDTMKKANTFLSEYSLPYRIDYTKYPASIPKPNEINSYTNSINSTITKDIPALKSSSPMHGGISIPTSSTKPGLILGLSFHSACRRTRNNVYYILCSGFSRIWSRSYGLWELGQRKGFPTTKTRRVYKTDGGVWV